jgi:indolepyruvate ferredoxin oxidoreductase beta subunit
MESLRYLPFLSEDGIIVTATEVFNNIANYPDHERIRAEIEKSAKHIFVDASALARSVGNAKTFNVVMLGAASPYIGIGIDQLEKAIEQFFSAKGKEIVEMNLLAFNKGLQN